MSGTPSEDGSLASDRSSRAKSIVEAVLSHNVEERAAYIATLCGGDADLIALVNQLLLAVDSVAANQTTPMSPGHLSTTDKALRTRVGPYELIRRVGDGGMGTVFAARRTDDYKKMVAVKLVKPGMESEEVLRRFRTERQVLASLDHPNIARIAGRRDRRGRRALPRHGVRRGHADRPLLRRQPPCRSKTACGFSARYARRCSTRTRTSSCTATSNPATSWSRLTAFRSCSISASRSCCIPSTSTTRGITRTAFQPFTPQYASPEQIRGDPITTATDVYLARGAAVRSADRRASLPGRGVHAHGVDERHPAQGTRTSQYPRRAWQD